MISKEELNDIYLHITQDKKIDNDDYIDLILSIKQYATIEDVDEYSDELKEIYDNISEETLNDAIHRVNYIYENMDIDIQYILKNNRDKICVQADDKIKDLKTRLETAEKKIEEDIESIGRTDELNIELNTTKKDVEKYKTLIDSLNSNIDKLKNELMSSKLYIKELQKSDIKKLLGWAAGKMEDRLFVKMLINRINKFCGKYDRKKQITYRIKYNDIEFVYDNNVIYVVRR